MLQCIEKRLFTLDQDITTVLPEWKDPDILTGFDEETGEPILKKAKNKITIQYVDKETEQLIDMLRFQTSIDSFSWNGRTTVYDLSIPEMG